jgi:hypothetical protein
MRPTDNLIEEIVTSSRIPWGKRRREVVRELRSHVDDFVLVARDAGHAEEEIERMVLSSFGDPHQMGCNFAWVYRRERAVLCLSVLGLSTLAIAILVAAGVLAVQAGVAAGFGIPFPKTLGSRHTIIESFDILATVAAYVGILSIERLFQRHRIPKAMATLSLIFAALFGVCAAAGMRAPFLVFGCTSAIFLRTVQTIWNGQAARLVTVATCFGLFGVWLSTRWPGFPSSAGVTCASWLVMGIGYQLMTGLAVRADRRIPY